MIKKIPVERLRPGMFLHSLNAGWMSHPFIRNRFLVADEEIIQRIVDAGIHGLGTSFPVDSCFLLCLLFSCSKHSSQMGR